MTTLLTSHRPRTRTRTTTTFCASFPSGGGASPPMFSPLDKHALLPVPGFWTEFNGQLVLCFSLDRAPPCDERREGSRRIWTLLLPQLHTINQPRGEGRKLSQHDQPAMMVMKSVDWENVFREKWEQCKSVHVGRTDIGNGKSRFDFRVRNVLSCFTVLQAGLRVGIVV